MRKMGYHFHKHDHHGQTLKHCRKLKKWSRGMECSKKAQSANEMHAMSHSSCTGHHDQNPNQHHKWCSWNMRRFHCFQHGHNKHHLHHQHSHGHFHHHKHHHHSHGQHQGCSHQNGENHPKRHEVHVHKCCFSFESRSKACQTDPDLEEAQETNHSETGAETDEVQPST